MYINPPRVPWREMATRIKFVNRMKPEETHAAIKQRKAGAPAAPVAQGRPRRAAQEPPLEARKTLEPRNEDDDARQTYEECRKAFNELAALHSAAQSEAADALRRLDKTEQELRRAREQSTGYAAQIAAQELEMRRVKEGKRAVEELNTRLSATVSGTGGKGGDAKLASAHKAVTSERDQLRSERDRLKSAHRAASEELEQLRSEHRDAMEERTKANEYKAFCDEMMQTVDKAVELCARACEPHAPDTARDMRETGQTLRALRQATLRK